MLDGDDQREYHWQRIDGEPVVMMYAEGDEEGRREGPTRLPLGAVIATCNLVDVVPMRAYGDRPSTGLLVDCPDDGALTHQQGGLWLIGDNDLTHGHPTRVEDQRPYGDFTPGRFAWVLDDIKPVAERCPACWRTAHCATCDDRGSVPVPGGGAACPDCFAATPADCKVCGDYGSAEPIPARGRQQIWNWTPAA
jgi:hypothetical protein